MKKLLISVLLLSGVLSVNAQETETGRQNDVMISPIELIAGPALNVSYERLLNKDSGIGINAVFLFARDGEDDGIYSQISPYYRMYFGKNYASGFFVEGFVPISMSNDGSYIYTNSNQFDPIYQSEKNTTVGVGVGFGGKWVARKNIVFEASIGIARRFGVDNEYDASVTGKGMLGIGYRF